MPMPLPNLDDRRWDDLVDEGRALIPVYSPDWTDHNVSDPGITFLELFAWITEMDVFQANQVPERHRLKFLALLGITPWPPRAARTVLRFKPLSNAASTLSLPMGLQFEGLDPFRQPTGFRTLQPIDVIPANLNAVQAASPNKLLELTTRWSRGEPVSPFGDAPEPGNSLQLGFDAALPTDKWISLWFMSRSDAAADEAERANWATEEADRARGCAPDDTEPACLEALDGPSDESPIFSGCGSTVFVGPPNASSTLSSTWPNSPAAAPASPTSAPSGPPAVMPLHHSARTVWEVYIGYGGWRPLDSANGEEVQDDTRAFTLNGAVRILLPASLGGIATGDPLALRRLRCRYEGGRYDAAPVLYAIEANAVPVEQAIRVAAAPALQRHHSGEAYGWIGTGTGWSEQRIESAGRPIIAESLSLYTIEDGAWLNWDARPDFDASGRTDRHFVLDPGAGMIAFGDGQQGRAVPEGVEIVARFMVTRAEAGNLAAGTVFRLAEDNHNRQLLCSDFEPLRLRLNDSGQLSPSKIEVINPVAAWGGAAAESVAEAEGRAIDSVERTGRAVTLPDYEALAKTTPGTCVARSFARANAHPAFPCFLAPGIVTLVIVPSLPADRPSPGPALRRTVAGYVSRRQVIGTRVEVVGPTYLEVAVRATVQALDGVDADKLRRLISGALDQFFNPLTGGPDGGGWPFGRDIYRSEVLQVIDETPGVDHVLALGLLAGGCDPQCGNVCVGPLGLVAVGRHEIEIEGGAAGCLASSAAT
jgi:hypothetical protein